MAPKRGVGGEWKLSSNILIEDLIAKDNCYDYRSKTIKKRKCTNKEKYTQRFSGGSTKPKN